MPSPHAIANSPYPRHPRHMEQLLQDKITSLTKSLASQSADGKGFSTKFANKLRTVIPVAQHLNKFVTAETTKVTQFFQKSPLLQTVSFLTLNKAMGELKTLRESAVQQTPKNEQDREMHQRELEYLDDALEQWKTIPEIYGQIVNEGFISPYMLHATKGCNSSKHIVVQKPRDDLCAVIKYAQPDLDPAAAKRIHEKLPGFDVEQPERQEQLSLYLKVLQEELPKIRSSVFQTSAKQIFHSGDNPLRPPQERALQLDPTRDNQVHGYGRYDIHVILLADRDKKLNADALNLATKFISKNVVLDMAGNAVASDHPSYTGDVYPIPPNSKVKLQIIGPIGIREQTTTSGQTEQEITLGGYSAEQLVQSVSTLFKKALGITIAEQTLNTTLLFKESGDATLVDSKSNVSNVKQKFAEAFAMKMLDTFNASLVNNLVSVHTSRIEILPNGTKQAMPAILLDPDGNHSAHDLDKEGGLADGTRIPTTSEKHTFRYNSSFIEPIGSTPQHLARVNLIEYLKNSERRPYNSSFEKLDICIIPRATFDGFATSDYLSTHQHLLDSARHRIGSGRTLFAICNGDKSFEFKQKVGQKIEDIGPEEARALVKTARDALQQTLDFTIRGGTAVEDSDSSKGITVASRSASEWAEITDNLLNTLGANGMNFAELSVRASNVAGKAATKANLLDKTEGYVLVNPRFVNDFARELHNRGYNSEMINAPVRGDASNPIGDKKFVYSPISAMDFGKSLQEKLYNSKNISSETFSLDGKEAHAYFVTEDRVTYSLGFREIKPDTGKTKPRNVTFQNILDNTKDMKLCAGVTGSPLYYRANPGLRQIEYVKKKAHEDRLQRPDQPEQVAPSTSAEARQAGVRVIGDHQRRENQRPQAAPARTRVRPPKQSQRKRFVESLPLDEFTTSASHNERTPLLTDGGTKRGLKA